MGTPTPPPLYGGVDISTLMQLMGAAQGAPGLPPTGSPGSPVQTRSGRISRPPPTPQKERYAPGPSPSGATSASATPPAEDTPKQGGRARPRGRPRLDPEEKLNRLRLRNKEAAEQDETLVLLDEKTRECRALEDRCHELEAQVRELQATLQAHRIPLPSVPGPSRSWRDYRHEQQSQSVHHAHNPPHNPHTHAHAHNANHASPAVTEASPAFRDHASPATFANQSPAFMLPQPYPPVYAGLEALAHAALPNLAPPTMSHVTPLDPTSAIGDLSTPLHTTPTPGPGGIDPDIQAALDALNLPAWNWRPDDDAISLSALFTLDDLGDEADANDADFVPPTSPKGESDSDSDDDDEEDKDDKDKGSSDKGTKSPAPTPTPPDEEEDLFLPIEDVPVPEDQLYADAMAALGVSTPAELKVVVNKIVETASRGGVTPAQVEGLRRLMRLAEVRGAALTGANASRDREEREAEATPPGKGRQDGEREGEQRERTREGGREGKRGREEWEGREGEPRKEKGKEKERDRDRKRRRG